MFVWVVKLEVSNAVRDQQIAALEKKVEDLEGVNAAIGGINVNIGSLQTKIGDMDKKVDRLESDIRQLLELANRGKGGLWFGMAVASALTGIVGFFAGKH